jgi:DNA end-binding protein Ku
MGRPIWTGAISFGLVNIPVRLEVAIHEKSVRFHMMSKDGSCRLRRKLYCPETGKEYDFGDTARGVEIGKGEYVILDEEEIERLRPDRGRVIEIEQFAELADLDPIYFNASYFLVPTEGSAKPYKLLLTALRKSQKVALAQFVIRQRAQLCALRVYGDGLVLHTMEYADEVEPIDTVLPAEVRDAKVKPQEAEVAVRLIESMTRPLDLAAFHDTFRDQVEELIEEKKHGGTTKVADEVEGQPEGATVDLMAALRRSLQASARPRRANHVRHVAVHSSRSAPRARASAKAR